MGHAASQTDSSSRLLAAHQELMRQITDLRSFWHGSNDSGCPNGHELADRVVNVRDLLEQHFAMEEDGGYLHAVLEFAPQFAERAEQLCRQHQEFLATLTRIEVRLRNPNAWNQVREEFETFLQEIQEHEHRENSMVQTAFNQEDGVGD